MGLFDTLGKLAQSAGKVMSSMNDASANATGRAEQTENWPGIKRD